MDEWKARLADHSTISGQGKGGEVLAIAWLTAFGGETEKVSGASCALSYSFLVPWGLQRWNGSCERKIRHGARLEDRVNLCVAFARAYIIPLYFLL